MKFFTANRIFVIELQRIRSVVRRCSRKGASRASYVDTASLCARARAAYHSELADY